MVSNVVVELVRASRVSELDKEKRGDDRRIGRDVFQRETLLDLQQAVGESARETGKLHLHDALEYRKTGSWGTALIGNEHGERERLAILRLALLESRVADEALRESVGRYREAAAVGMAKDESSSNEAMDDASEIATAILERAGELIRDTFVRE
ncbi:MAG: hypothetical protein ACRDFW_11670 [bacterium]